MRSRVEGMWWGLAIESPDPSSLAAFYSELLGWPVGHEEPGTAILPMPRGTGFVVFQQADGYQRPTWPPAPGAQRPMMHIDVQVGDLGTAVDEAVALGATLVHEQPNDQVRVLLDPDGHPSCLCLDE